MVEILLADDSEDTHELVKLALGEQYRVTCVPTVSQVMPLLKERRFDLLLLDVSLPDGTGFQICAQARNIDFTRQIPIIFLTGKTGVANLVTGFSLGADDYIEKPFNPLELKVRIQAKINRDRRTAETENQLLRGDLRLNLLRQTVSILAGSEELPIELKPFEFKLLLYFMQNEERVLSRQQLLDAIWGPSTFIVDRTIDKHICSLRQKLATCAPYVQTVLAFGYKFSSQNGARQSG